MSAVALQNAVYDALTDCPDVMSAVVGVYDNPQQVANPDNNAEFPFITIGQASHAEWDTDTELGNDVTVFIHVWSRAHHFIECKAVQDLIYACLHRVDLDIDGYRSITMHQVLQDAQKDQDGVTIHGVQEFTVLMQQED